MSLPPPPARQAFADQEQFEEALGFWQARVGRIRGLVESSKRKQLDDEIGEVLGYAPATDVPKG